MMDDVVAHPAGRQLWGGNNGCLFKMVPIGTVIDTLVAGIEKRARFIVCPKAHTLVAKAPGLFRPIFDRAFGGPNVVRAIELAAPAGWSNQLALDRHAPTGPVNRPQAGNCTL
ncbi:hypothetical protein [Mycolicibacterium sp. CBMA 226]|uniref:hypothetical protein n=1 Tax=Mycolicibacterium sp. CBMA 226 TaxID=2606611 RepID=UPI001316C4E7|nr:hypothetical protein [Mycolicibacterium sp. CBMA 226]QGW61300.1 hypothetical protein ICEMyc226_00268 [Mycolicibacterium sp.]